MLKINLKFSEMKMNDSFEEAILKELCESRTVPPAPPIENHQDGNLHFCHYLTSLMNDMPRKKYNFVI